MNNNITLNENIINEFEFFQTTRDINLNDGTFIKKDTEFRIEGQSNNVYLLHFEDRKDNIYQKDNADGYGFKLEHIKEFALPTKYSIEQFEKKQRLLADPDYSFLKRAESFVLSNEYDKTVDEKSLTRLQRIFEAINNIKQDISPVKGEFNFKHLNNINKALIGNIHKLPVVPVEKLYTCNKVLKALTKEKFTKVNSIDEFLDKTVKYIVELHNMNLFNKGSAITLQHFTKTLGKGAGFNIDTVKMPIKSFKKGLSEAKEDNCEFLKGLIKDYTSNVEPLREIMKSFEVDRGIDR